VRSSNWRLSSQPCIWRSPYGATEVTAPVDKTNETSSTGGPWFNVLMDNDVGMKK